MPQIAQLATTYSSQIFWLLVFFGLVFFVVGRGMVPKVMATVDARDKQIAADLAAADAARKAADAQEEAWRVQANRQRAEAQATIAAAKAEAAKAAEARLAVANQGIDARLAEAEARIDHFLAANPRNKHGRVVYDLIGDFGVDVGALRERFAFYYDRFPVRREAVLGETS